MSRRRRISPENLPESDLANGSTGDAAARAAGTIWLIRGTKRDDDIQGLERSEKIVGLGGDDTIDAGGGRDILLGGAGNDILNGMDGEDVLYGGDGDDDLFGGAGKDTLFGGLGNDYLSGGGNDTLFGDGGDDIFSLSKGDWASGGAGNDTFRINDKDALVHGGIGIDTIKFNKQAKQFAFVYQDEGLLVRYTQGGGGSPTPSAVADGEIERLAFGKGVVIDRRDVSTPEIRAVWNGQEYVPLDKLVTTEVYEIRGTADPGARVTVMLGDTIFRTVVTDHTGTWRVRELDPLTLPEKMQFTAIADFGLADHTATSQTVEIRSPLRLQNFSDAHGIVFDGADNRYARDLTVSLG
ncbi:MAG: calcium-binding protein, partial [Alphaproteobacteria bacterium]